MNVNKLKAKCVERGINIDTLSKNVGIDRGTFYRKLNNDGFSVEDAVKISDNLELTNVEILTIFFEKSVA